MDRFNNTPLADAINHNHGEVVRWLMERGGATDDALEESLSVCIPVVKIFLTADNEDVALILFFG